jgi:protein TonB
MSMRARMTALVALSAALHVALVCAWSMQREQVSGAGSQVAAVSLELRPAHSISLDADPAPMAGAVERTQAVEPRQQAVPDSSSMPASVISEQAGEEKSEAAEVAEWNLVRTDAQSTESPGMESVQPVELIKASPRDALPAPTFSDDDPAPQPVAAVTAEQLAVRIHEAVQPYFEYPLLARRKGWEGEVLLALRVESDGSLRVLRVLSSSGYRLLDRAAVEALARLARLPDARGLPHKGMETELPVVYRLIDPA